MIPNDKALLIKEKLPWRTIEGETVIVDVGKVSVLRLDGVGSDIWMAIDGTRTASDIISFICDTYDVEEDAARKDVMQFLEKLHERGLIGY